MLSPKAVNDIVTRYESRYREYGYTPRTLDWDKGKQQLRFSVLTSQYDCRGKTILDIGCGFGDLNVTLNQATAGNYQYLGIDVTPSLLSEATVRYGSPTIQFKCGDFLALNIPEADYAIASGTFNLKLTDGNNLDFIEAVFQKTFDICRDGFAFDFLSDKVDFRKENTFHSSPEQILALAYRFSRRVILRNDYMPFEFSVFVFKDDSFDPKRTIFARWLAAHAEADH